jgi:hypothetical protein
MTMLGRHLLETGQLRDGIGLDEVRDVPGPGQQPKSGCRPIRRTGYTAHVHPLTS